MRRVQNEREELRNVGFVCGGYSSPARGRDNQDRYRLSRNGLVVCDGIGGLEAGEVFAEMAAWKAAEQIERGQGASVALEEASALLREFKRSAHIEGGASGSAVTFGSDGGCVVCSCGDTRAFLVKEGVLVEVGQPSEDERGFLTDYLGSSGECGRYTVDEITPDEMRGSVLLLMSDGVWRYLSAAEVEGACGSLGSSPVELAADLVERAKSCMSPDDCTVAACRAVMERPADEKGKDCARHSS